MATKTSDWRPGPTVCRCCLSEGCYKDISTEYFWMGKREVYAEMLSDTLNLTIAYSKSGPNSNSRLICEPCISRLRDAHDFRRQVVECEKTFMQHLDPGSSILQKELEMNLEEVKVEQVKQEKKASDDEDFDDRIDFVVDNDDTDDDLDDEPLMKLATKVPKKEKEVDLLDLLDNSQVTVKRKSTASSSKAKEPPAKKAKKQIVIKPSASKATASASKPGEKKKKEQQRRIVITESKETESSAIRENLAVIFDCSNVCPFLWRYNVFGCMVCSYKSCEFPVLKKHYSTHKNKSDLVKHVRTPVYVKVDVSSLKCSLCDVDIDNIKSLMNHLVVEHKRNIHSEVDSGVLPFVLMDGYKCPDCNSSFDNFLKLRSHLSKHYPRFACSQCGKTFTHKMNLKDHLEVHDKPATVACSKCGKEFTSKSLQRTHEINEHNLFPYKCQHCDMTFKLFTQRVQHMNKYHDMNITYPCDFCPVVCSHSSARASHMRRVHINERRHLCSVCGKTFFSPTELKQHMIKHGEGSEKIYKCKICKKFYSREKVLKAHLKTHISKVSAV